MMKHFMASSRDHRGSVLLMTALFSFVLFLLAMTLFRVLPAEFHSAKKARRDTVAHYSADAGVKTALVWLESQPSTRPLTQQVLDDEFNAVYHGQPRVLSGDWGYRVRLSVNPDGSRFFDVVATAFFRERAQRQIRTTVERQSFAGYALFIDTWPEDLVYGLGSEGLSGPFHTNDFFRLAAGSPEFWSGDAPAFVRGSFARMTHARSFSGGELAFEGDGNAYYSGATGVNDDEGFVPFDGDGAMEPRYQRIVEGGRSGLSVVPAIPLPSGDADLLQRSLGVNGESVSIPGEQGLHVAAESGQVKGGVFYQGNVELQLRLDLHGNQIQDFTREAFNDAYQYSTNDLLPFPIYEWQQVEGLVPEVIAVQREETYQELVRYEETLVVTANGINQIVEVPIYEPRVRTVTVYVETGNMIPGSQGVLVEVGEEERPVTENHIISVEEYEANPADYPGAVPVLLPGGQENSRVVEVSASEGYTIARGSLVDGEPIASEQIVPKDHTVVVDGEGNHQVLAGNLNGVTYVNGNINALAGVSKGHAVESEHEEPSFDGRIITANLRFGRSIELTGDLLQYYDGDDPARQHPGRRFTLKPGELSPDSQHALGLVTETVLLHPANRQQNIYAVILAGRTLADSEGRPLPDPNNPEKFLTRGGFGVNSELLDGGGAGQFRLFGGVIEARALPWLRDGNGLAGQLVYDPAAARGLGAFPQTNHFSILRYAESATPDG